MNEEKKQMIMLALETLKRINQDCGVSMGFDKSNDKLMFFETDEYLASGKFKGFAIKLEELV